MRYRLWIELTQAKFNIEYANLYAERQRTLLRYSNIFVLVFSTGGIMGWAFWDNIPLIACVVIGVVSLVRHIQPQLIMTEKQIYDLETISNFYISYYNKLERLWYDYDDGQIDYENLKAEFFKIKNSESEINSLVNETIRTKPKNLLKKSKEYSDQYFKFTYNTFNNE